MKRKKPKHKDDQVFHLEQELRELKALNRSLLRELKKRNRGIHRDELKFQPEYIPEVEKPKVKICIACGKGELNLVIVGHLKFHVCNLCEDRIKIG